MLWVLGNQKGAKILVISSSLSLPVVTYGFGNQSSVMKNHQIPIFCHQIQNGLLCFILARGSHKKGSKTNRNGLKTLKFEAT